MASYLDLLMKAIEAKNLKTQTGYFDFCVSHNNRGKTYFPFIKLDNSLAGKLVEHVEEEGWEVSPLILFNIQAGKKCMLYDAFNASISHLK